MKILIRGIAWVAESAVAANNVHPLAECSNRGTCDRKTGTCNCYFDYTGIACEQTSCPSDCEMNGVCLTERELAEEAGRVYVTPWDADKHVGCVCDLGYRGYDCSRLECPSGPDIMRGLGNAAGRDCSGRGWCNYDTGICNCFVGFYGNMCQHKAATMIS